MRRIVVLGCAGSGKSTLARQLADAGALRLIVLDALWPPGRQGDLHTFRDELAELHAAEAWVSDGNFARASFDIRLPPADVVVWLETPRWLCLWRSIVRPLRRGEPHRISGLPRALGYIWRFDRVNRPLIERLRETHAPKAPVIRLRTRRDIEDFVADFRARASPSGAR